MIIINTDTDRITYKIENIPLSLKIITIYGNLILSKEQSSSNSLFEELTLFDVAEKGTARDKILFKIKYQKNITSKVTTKKHNPDKNLILQQS